MSLEARVEHLESKFDTLDSSMRELMRVVSGTHEVVGLILKDQMEMRKELFEFKGEVRTEFKAVRSEFNERFDQLELLIRQHFTS